MARIRALPAGTASRKLVHRIGRIADNVRQIATNLGARPFRVFLVWEVWDGGEKGEGDVSEYRRIEILPTPMVDNIDALASPTSIAGTVPTGNIRVRDVSVQRYDHNTLSGYLFPNDAEKIPEPYDFFYEVVQDDRHEAKPRRWKFNLTAPPALIPTRATWTLLLERASEDRNRDGVDQAGQDTD